MSAWPAACPVAVVTCPCDPCRSAGIVGAEVVIAPATFQTDDDSGEIIIGEVEVRWRQSEWTFSSAHVRPLNAAARAVLTVVEEASR